MYISILTYEEKCYVFITYKHTEFFLNYFKKVFLIFWLFKFAVISLEMEIFNFKHNATFKNEFLTLTLY